MQSSISIQLHPPPAHIFNTTLAEAVPPSERKPNYSSIAQSLLFAGIYSTDTVLQSVCSSSPFKYYVAENGRVEEKDKGLIPLEDLGGDVNTLEKHVQRFAAAVSGEKISCTITGGFDSRLVLAHVLHSGLNPILNISGSAAHVDVRIAREIAQRLGRDLLWISDEIEDDDWIDKSIQAADGMEGVCRIYRLNKRARRMRESGILLSCGGLGGECYKNRYMSGSRSYGGQPDWEAFRSFLGTGSFPLPASVLGEAIAEEIERLPAVTREWLQSHTGKTKASAYLSAGYEIMQTHGTAMGNMNAKYYIPYEPLLERTVAGAAFQIDPRKLEMNAFHREQISRLCPEIKDIKTDHGESCNAKWTLQERLQYRYGKLRPKVARLLRPNKVRARIDVNFQQGLSSPQLHAAVERCKELGILSPTADIAQIAPNLLDRLFAVGSLL